MLMLFHSTNALSIIYFYESFTNFLYSIFANELYLQMYIYYIVSCEYINETPFTIICFSVTVAKHEYVK